MGFGTPSAVVTGIEGEGTYSTWTYLGKVADIPDYYLKSVWLTVDNQGNIYMYHEGFEDISYVKIFNKEFQTLSRSGGVRFGKVGSRQDVPGAYAHTNNSWQVQSVCKKYSVFFKEDTHEMKVIRSYPVNEDPESPPNWLPVFIRDIDEDYDSIRSGSVGLLWWSISPNGKYIVVYVEKDTEDAWFLMLYEGS